MKFRGGMNELMRQASRMQRKIEKRKEELKDEEFEAKKADDKITVVANGAGELIRVAIDPSILDDEGLEMLQDLLVAASNDALARSKEHVDAELEKVTGGLKIPGVG